MQQLQVLLFMYFSADSDEEVEERPSFGQPRGMKRKMDSDEGQSGITSGEDGDEDDINPSKFIRVQAKTQLQTSSVVGKMMVSGSG